MLKPITLVVSLAVCLSSAFSMASEVNIYSARKEMLIKPLLDKFTEDTGIKVNLVTGKADALLARLLNEGKLTPADVLLTTDAGRLYRAKEAGMLQPVMSSYLNKHIPAHLRDVDNQWFGLSTRARPIMYSM
ncbi:MAG: substrate-binding domain-containing protein, partial [Sinobacterium sp.]|nr:substrate-binding domain-containing protein [Sinobacterium sp.]